MTDPYRESAPSEPAPKKAWSERMRPWKFHIMLVLALAFVILVPYLMRHHLDRWANDAHAETAAKKAWEDHGLREAGERWVADHGVVARVSCNDDVCDVVPPTSVPFVIVCNRGKPCRLWRH